MAVDDGRTKGYLRQEGKKPRQRVNVVTLTGLLRVNL